MTIVINGEVRDLAEPVNLGRLLDNLDLPAVRVAVELNRIVIRRKDWELTMVKPGDKLEIIQFVGGG